MKTDIKKTLLFLMILCSNCTSKEERMQIDHYDDGSVKSIGKIKKSQKIGVWAFYDELGTRVDSVQYSNGMKNGWAKGYDLRIEQLDKKGQYVEDKAEGIWESYHEGGAVHSRETFKAGNRIGESIYYYAKGTPKVITRYDSSGQPHGKTEEFYVSGKPMVTGQYHNGKLDGEWKEYYENGLLKEVYHCQSGLWHGTYEKYHPNGNIAEKGTYELDKPSGIWQYFDSNGMVISKRKF